MTDIKVRKHALSPSEMTAKEKAMRSRIAQLANGAPFARGVVAVREKKCGKATCRCANGDLHRGVYLTLSLDGKLRQISIPAELEGQVRQWVQNYQRIRDLLEEVSQLYMEKIRKKREP
ncbi:MAG: hypothetical protein H0W34_14315 [Pyrinomonadaceae bacterium]|nr:hypothetical protein [Pyrinomonadaceae bacterium]